MLAAATAINALEVIDPKTGVGKGEWNISEPRFKEELEKLKKHALYFLSDTGGLNNLASQDPEVQQLKELGYTDDQIRQIQSQ